MNEQNKEVGDGYSIRIEGINPFSGYNYVTLIFSSPGKDDRLHYLPIKSIEKLINDNMRIIGWAPNEFVERLANERQAASRLPHCK